MIYNKEEYINIDIPTTSVDSKTFNDDSFIDTISSRISVIVYNESPISKSALTKKILDSFSVKKTSANIKTIEKAIEKANIRTTEADDMVVFWSVKTIPESYYCFRVNPERKVGDIPLVEIKNAVCFVLERKGALAEKDIIDEVALQFGYKKAGSDLRKAVRDSIKIGIENEEIKSEGNKLSLSLSNRVIRESFVPERVKVNDVKASYAEVAESAIPQGNDQEKDSAISVIKKELRTRSQEKRNLENKIQGEKDRLKQIREKEKNNLLHKVKPVAVIADKISDKKDAEQLSAFVEREKQHVQARRNQRMKHLADANKKTIILVAVFLIVIVASASGISKLIKSNDIKNTQALLLDSFQNTTTVYMNNFGRLPVNVPSDWIASVADNSSNDQKTFINPVTRIQRILNKKDKLLALEDVRYLGEKSLETDELEEIATGIVRSYNMSGMKENLFHPVNINGADVLCESWMVTSEEGDEYRIITETVHVGDSCYAVSGLISDYYYSDDIFPEMIDNAGFAEFTAAKPMKLSVEYKGSTKKGTVILYEKSKIKAKVTFDNGKTQSVTEGLKISGDSAPLDVGDTRDYNVAYTYAGKTISSSFPVTCTTKFDSLKLYYNGPKWRGTEINDLSNFKVVAVYHTPNEKDIEENVTEESELKKSGTLKANKSKKFVVKYEDKTASYKIKCSTKMKIEAEYNGSNAAGTNIDSLKDFKVTAIYTYDEDELYEFDNSDLDEEEEVDVTKSAKLENTAVLKEGRKEVFTISYEGATAKCEVECPITEKKEEIEYTTTYIVNIKSGVFHVPGCWHIRQMSAANEWVYEGTREELIKRHYTPCGTCHP